MMNNSDMERRIRELAKLAGNEATPQIDVTERVLKSVGRVQHDTMLHGTVVLDTTPLWFGGALAALAAGFMLVFFTSFSTITEPWISFWLM